MIKAAPASFGASLSSGRPDRQSDRPNDRQRPRAREPAASTLDVEAYFGGLQPPGSLAATILTGIHTGAYECMICIESVNRRSKVWTCDTCSRVFHLKCIQKWASQAKNKPPPASQPELAQTWRCPGCQTTRTEIPDKYRCWCGKIDNPEINHLAPPHSCGQTCSHEYSSCPHMCNLPCHPGPHPKCTALGPALDCFCGKASTQRRCVDTRYEGWSCDTICGEVMACGVHTCPRPCHSGLCGPCKAQIRSDCYCGKHDRSVTCDAALPLKESFYRDADGNLDSWSGIWRCDEVCGRYYDCGVHHCENSCHPQDLEPAHCPLSPDVIDTCACGKESASSVLGRARESCEEPVPLCGKPCLRKLDCGHICKRTCHTGPCWPCNEQITVPCRCTFSNITLSCHELENGTPECQRQCKVSLHCQRHECGIRCCPASRAAALRIASKKKKFSPHLQLETIIEPEHFCTRTCNRVLKCGTHTCTMICHRGPCPTCLEATFDELTCNCGRTRIMPPIPCGTKPPPCRHPCTRPTPCGHPVIAHNCHLDDESCPKCPYFVDRKCMCGKTTVKNVPCSRSQVACINVCDKVLKCGAHKCKKRCHREGECEDPCAQLCGKIKTCGHPCEAACHSPFQCEEEQPCTTSILVKCPCGNLETRVECRATKNKEGPKRELRCNDQCALLSRNKRLAEALKIEADPMHMRENAAVHTDATLEVYAKNKRWCDSIEEVLDQFVVQPTKMHYTFPPMKSPQRRFIHMLAESYKLLSESQDPEPQRSVAIHRTPRTSLPEWNLAQSYAIYVKLNAPTTVSPAPPTPSTISLAVPKKQPTTINALLVKSVRVGLTLAELESELEKFVPTVSRVALKTRFVADEDVLLQPAVSPFNPEDTENEIYKLRDVLREQLVTVLGLAEKLELTRIPFDNTAVYSKAWVPPSRAVLAKFAKRPIASPNSFSALSEASKAQEAPLAESWETLDETDDQAEDDVDQSDGLSAGEASIEEASIVDTVAESSAGEAKIPATEKPMEETRLSLEDLKIDEAEVASIAIDGELSAEN
ncbi:uncharacterized protein V1510DRAFT_390432 [Dipodascopsis tothii]|uniref:uncharacterized protein n=1 Tax=Dipodascopsis tothii TaxID=44089 RepID=UPI0034CED275